MERHRWAETIGYGHHAASGHVFTSVIDKMRGGVMEDIDVGIAVWNESAKTMLRRWYEIHGYNSVKVLETEFPGSFIIKGRHG